MKLGTTGALRALGLAAVIGATLIRGLGGGSAWASDALHHESWSWNGHVAAGRTLAIHGINGAIVAEPGTGDAVEVAAEKTSKRSDTRDVRIEVKQDSDGITICAVYPGKSTPCEKASFGFHKRADDVEVEFRVRVPAGVTFEASTVNGAVAARALRGPVKASTVNGRCEIETTGRGEASTVNGSVDASIGRLTANDAVDLSTVNGSITLRLPQDANAEIDGSTVNGSIQTDFPVTVEGKWGPRHMHATIGRGGAKVSASTVNGGIHLVRSVAQ